MDRAIAIGREYQTLVSEDASEELEPFVEELEAGAARMRRLLAQGRTPRRMPELPLLDGVVDIQAFRAGA